MPFRVQTDERGVFYLSPSEPMRESAVLCDGCPAPCCRHPQMLIMISFDEAAALGKQLADVTLPDGREFDNVAVLPRDQQTGACSYVTSEGRCSVWDKRPQACRHYDCRTDPNVDMREFVAKRFA